MPGQIPSFEYQTAAQTLAAALPPAPNPAATSGLRPSTALGPAQLAPSARSAGRARQLNGPRVLKRLTFSLSIELRFLEKHVMPI